ncbi:MAG: EamA family transporter [Parvularculaceae bacterium]
MKRTIALYALALAGVAWGVYSVLGKTEAEPATATARNFILSVPFAALLFLTPRASFHAEPEGVALAVASGALASGLGYVIWYAALRGLTNMAAAVVQLAVPVVAAAGGVLFLEEAVTARLAVASALILGGVFVTIRASLRRPSPRTA